MLQGYETIAIIGASSGLGAALAESFAKSGCHLFLCARRTALLKQMAEKCRQKGATVSIAEVDVRLTINLSDWVTQIDDERPVDLLIVNSGIFDGNMASDQLESASTISNVLSTNLTGALVAASNMAGRMQARRSGRIALVSSLAAFYPHADAPTYSASKAGLTAYGTALREYLLPYRVGVSLIHPGHIESDHTKIQMGRLPAIMSAEQAAEKIAEALLAGRDNISFPMTLRFLISLSNLLPWKTRALINKPFRFIIRK